MDPRIARSRFHMNRSVKLPSSMHLISLRDFKFLMLASFCFARCNFGPFLRVFAIESFEFVI